MRTDRHPRARQPWRFSEIVSVAPFILSYSHRIGSTIETCVSPSRGIGRYLIQEMTTLGGEASHAVIIARTANFNVSSIAPFSKGGFLKVGQQHLARVVTMDES